MKRLFQITMIMMMVLLIVSCTDVNENINLDDIASSVSIGYASGDSITSVTKNLTLPNTDIEGAVISWTSDHEAILIEGDQGIISRSDIDITVTLTVTASLDGRTGIATHDVIVKALENLDEYAETVVIGYASGDSITSVTKNLTLPNTDVNGAVISWTSNHAAIVIEGNQGVITRTDDDITVTLTVTASKDGETGTKTHVVVVKALDNLESYVETVLIGYASGDSNSSVTNNLTLPNTDVNGAVISWTSNHAAIVIDGNQGIVTRLESDTLVTLTVTATKDGRTGSKTHIVNILAMEVFFEVSFIDGETTSNVDVLKNDKVNRPADPSKEGFYFLGWFDGEKLFDFDSPITKDIVLTAHYTEVINAISGLISDIYGPLENVLITFDSNNTLSLVDGTFILDGITPNIAELTFEKEGYISKKLVITNDDFNYLGELILEEITLELEYGYLGSIGGVNTVPYEGYFTRNKDELIFKFVTPNPTTANGNQGMGLFISTTQNAGTVRSADEILFGFYLGGGITIANYPNNVKTNIASGTQNLPMGIKTHTEVFEHEIVLYAYISYDSLNQIRNTDIFDAYHTYGISLTSDNLNDNTFDVWSRTDLKGIDNNAIVSRFNPRDYLRMSANNLLYWSDNNYSTLIYGTTEPNANLSFDGIDFTSDNDGNFQLAFNRSTNTGELIISKYGYISSVQSIEFTDQNQSKHIEVSLAEYIFDFEVKIIDGDTLDPIENASILFNGETYHTDEFGQVIIPSLSLFNPVDMSVEKTDFLTINRTITLAELELETLTIELFSSEVLMIYSGTIYDVNGPVAGAVVSIDELSIETNTDLDGSYEFVDILIGDYTLIVTSLGHETKSETALMAYASEGRINLDIEIIQEEASLGALGTDTKAITTWNSYLTRSSEYLRFRFDTTQTLSIDESSTEFIDIFMHIGLPDNYRRSEFSFGLSIRPSNIVEIYNYPNNGKKTIVTFTGSIENKVYSVWEKEGDTTTVTVYIYHDLFESIDLKYKTIATDTVNLSMNTGRGSAYHWWTREDLPGVFIADGFAVNRNIPVDYIQIDSFNQLSSYDENFTEAQFNDLVNSKLTSGPIFNLESLASATAPIVGVMSNNVQMFSDRTSFLFGPNGIKSLFGLNFTQGSINGSSTTVTKSGYVIIAAPFGSNNSEYHQLNNKLVSEGWQLVLQRQYNLEVFRLGSITDEINYYVKWIEKDEVVTYGKWHITFYKNEE